MSVGPVSRWLVQTSALLANNVLESRTAIFSRAVHPSKPSRSTMDELAMLRSHRLLVLRATQEPRWLRAAAVLLLVAVCVGCMATCVVAHATMCGPSKWRGCLPEALVARVNASDVVLVLVVNSTAVDSAAVHPDHDWIVGLQAPEEFVFAKDVALLHMGRNLRRRLNVTRIVHHIAPDHACFGRALRFLVVDGHASAVRNLLRAAFGGGFVHDGEELSDLYEPLRSDMGWLDWSVSTVACVLAARACALLLLTMVALALEHLQRHVTWLHWWLHVGRLHPGALPALVVHVRGVLAYMVVMLAVVVAVADAVGADRALVLLLMASSWSASMFERVSCRTLASVSVFPALQFELLSSVLLYALFHATYGFLWWVAMASQSLLLLVGVVLFLNVECPAVLSEQVSEQAPRVGVRLVAINVQLPFAPPPM